MKFRAHKYNLGYKCFEKTLDTYRLAKKLRENTELKCTCQQAYVLTAHSLKN